MNRILKFRQLSAILLLSLPGEADHSPPYKTLVLDEDPTRFPFASKWIVNLSTQTVKIGLGDDVSILSPCGKTLRKDLGKSSALLLSIPAREEGEWKPVYCNFFPNWGEERGLFLIVESIRNEKMHVELRVVLETKLNWERAQAETAALRMEPPKL